MGLLKRFLRSFLRKGKKKSKDNALCRIRSTSSVYSWPGPRQPQATHSDASRVGDGDTAEATKQLRRNTSPPTPTRAAVSHSHRPLSVERMTNIPSTEPPSVMRKLPFGMLSLFATENLNPDCLIQNPQKIARDPSDAYHQH